jgi:hypothetical protein
MLPGIDVSKTKQVLWCLPQNVGANHRNSERAGKQKAAFSSVCARIIKNFFLELLEPMQKK